VGLKKTEACPALAEEVGKGFGKPMNKKEIIPPHFSTHLFLLRHGCGHPQPSIFELIIELYQTGNITVRT